MRGKYGFLCRLLVAGVVLPVLASACGGAPSSKADSDLFAAIEKNDVKTLQNLISQGADTNAKNSKGMTPLHLAVASNDGKIIGILLEAGADLTVTDSKGRTPLELAQQEGKAIAENALR